MSLIAAGVSHKYSPIEIRERFSLKPADVRSAILDKIIVVSTCNRAEIYASVADTKLGMLCLKDIFKGTNHYLYIDKAALRHLLKVISGIDSQIIGEGQILEQVKSAYNRSKAAGLTDDLLDFVLEAAIEAAVRIKKEAKFSGNDVSIATVVIEAIKNHFGFLQGKNILILGTGKVSQLISPYINKEGLKATFVSNKNFNKALDLARHSGAEAIRFDKLKERLQCADIIISATASPHFLLKKEDLYGIDKQILIIDLAVPRDVEPAAENIPGIKLLNLDGLNPVIAQLTEERKRFLPKALEIIEKESDILWKTGSLKLEPEPALLR